MCASGSSSGTLPPGVTPATIWLAASGDSASQATITNAVNTTNQAQGAPPVPRTVVDPTRPPTPTTPISTSNQEGSGLSFGRAGRTKRTSLRIPRKSGVGLNLPTR